MATRILLIEADRALREASRLALSCEGLHVLAAAAVPPIEDHDLDLVIVDQMSVPCGVPKLCEHLRTRARDAPPWVLLTADRSVSAEALTMLEKTVDALLLKPFGPLELAARVQALLRRRHGRAESAVGADRADWSPRRAGDLELDPPRRRVRLGSRAVKVTELEFRLLYILAGDPGRVFPRSSLLHAVWGQNRHVTSRSVDVLIKRLRQRLGSGARDRTCLETIRGVGYRLAVTLSSSTRTDRATSPASDRVHGDDRRDHGRDGPAAAGGNARASSSGLAARHPHDRDRVSDAGQHVAD